MVDDRAPRTANQDAASAGAGTVEPAARLGFVEGLAPLLASIFTDAGVVQARGDALASTAERAGARAAAVAAADDGGGDGEEASDAVALFAEAVATAALGAASPALALPMREALFRALLVLPPSARALVMLLASSTARSTPLPGGTTPPRGSCRRRRRLPTRRTV